jgi:hypothetical protein
MTEKFVIQVNIVEFMDRKITCLETSNYSIRVGQLFLLVLEEETGGLLCITHFHLPEVKLPPNDWFFPVEIHCCCKRQVSTVEKRLAEIFR